MATALKTTVVEFLMTTMMGEEGRLTVPKQFREGLGLGAGAPVTMLRIGDGLILIPEQRRFEQLCHGISSALSPGGVEPGTLLTTLPKARKRVFGRRYGGVAAQ